MSLRIRILLGYGYLVVLLLLAAVGALLGFFHLSAGIDAVLEENFASVRAAMAMVERLERQDSLTLANLAGRRGTAELAQETKRLDGEFLAALGRSEANVTEPGEEEILVAIRSSFEAYRGVRRELLSSAPEAPLAAYDQEVFPAFTEAKNAVVRLLEVNQQAMFRADREARRSAVRNGTWLGFLVALALVSLVLLSRALQRDLLRRLDALRGGLEAVVAGAGQRRLDDRGDDELAAIAGHVNAILDHHQRTEGRFQGRLARERQLVLALVLAMEDGSEIFDLSGQLAAGDPGPTPRRRAVSEWIAGEGRDRLEDQGTVRAEVEAHGRKMALRLLRAGRRPVGWLATPVGDGG